MELNPGSLRPIRVCLDAAPGILLCAALLVLGGACTTTGSGNGADITADIPRSDSNVPQKQVAESARRVFEKAVSLYEQGGKSPPYAQILGLLEKAVDEDKCFARAHFNMGVVKHEQGEHDDAIDAYKKAHECDGTFAAPLVNMGMIYMEQGEEEKAFAVFERAIAVEEFNPEANVNLAVMFRQRAEASENEQDYLQAVNHVRRALAGDSTSVPAYNVLARVYYDLKKYDLARLVCINAQEFEADDPDIHNTLGLIFLKLDNVTLALREFKRVVEVDPDYVEAHMNIGSISLSTRDTATAIKHFEAVLSLNPKHIEAMLSLAVAYRQSGDLDKGMDGYKKVLALDGENAMAHFNIAVMHHEIKAVEAENPDKAIEHYRSAIENYRNFLSFYKGNNAALRQDADKRIGNCTQLIQTQEELKEILKQEKEAGDGGGDEGGEGGAEGGGEGQ